MERYAVKVTWNDGTVRYVSIGTGLSPDPQNAHLYHRRELADDKAAYYNSHKQWYQSAEVVTVEVTWPS